MMISKLSVIILSLALLSPIQKDEWLEAEGAGETQTKATQDALRMVVDQGVGVWLEARSLLINHSLKEDVVQTIVRGYVRRYEIIEQRQQGGIWRVRIRAKVQDVLEGVDKRFAEAPELYRQAGEPRVIILLPETVNGKPLTGKQPARFAIMETLRKEGIRVVDKMPVIKNETIRAAEQGNASAIWELSEQTQAEIILTGKANAEPFGEFADGEVHSARANIELKAIWADDGEVLASKRLSRVAGADFQESGAIQKALENAAQQLMEKEFIALMVAAFANEAAEGRTVCLRLRGNHSELMALQNAAERYEYFVRLVRDEYEDNRKEGRLWLRIKGEPNRFVRYLVGQKIRGKSLSVVRKSASGREVTLKT
jgi:hypothetical protein